MKRFLALFITILLTMCCTITVFAAEDRQRVFDKAGVFTAEEAAGLEDELKEAVDEIGMDFVILTTSDKEGASLQDYADDFYDYGGFGTDAEGSGLLMLIDMEDRTVYVSTKGKAIKYLTDKRLSNLTDNNDQLYEYLASGYYEDAVQNVIGEVEDYVEQGIPGAKKLTFFEILLAIAVPALVAYLYISSIKRQYTMKAEKENSANYAIAYRNTSAFAFAVNADELISHKVVTRIIPVTSNHSDSDSDDSGHSTTHTSHSGSIHGGGGGGRHF